MQCKAGKAVLVPLAGSPLRRFRRRRCATMTGNIPRAPALELGASTRWMRFSCSIGKTLASLFCRG